MKYIINIVIVLDLLFIGLLITTWQVNNKKIMKKLKIVLLNTIHIIPMFLLSGGILFIIFVSIFNMLSINEFFLDILIVSIYGVLIVYLGDYISKVIIKKISFNNFTKGFMGKSLSEEEKNEIVRNNQKSFFYWTYILNFLISGLFYSLIIEIMLNESNLLIVVLMSLTSVMFYETIFKRISG